MAWPDALRMRGTEGRIARVSRIAGPGSWRWYLLFGAAGGLAIGIQSYLLREYLVLLQGDEVGLGLGLFAWFVGIACGASLARRVSEQSARRIAGLGMAAMGTLGLVAPFVVRLARSLVGLAPGELLSLGPALALASCLFTPVGAAVGAAFVALARCAAIFFGDARLAIGKLYAFEALGSLVVGVVTSLVLFVAFTPATGIGMLVGLGAACALPAAWVRSVVGVTPLSAVVASALAVAFTPLGHWLDDTTERARFAALVPGASLSAYEHTPYQHLAIGNAEPRVFYANGQYVAAFPDPASDELAAHPLMLMARRRARVLGLGGLEMGVLRFCLRHPIERLDLLILDERAFHFVARYLDPLDRAALEDPRVHVILDEPRRYLERTGERYDLIVSLVPDPNTLLLARTTSVEFDRLVLARLAPEGTYALRFTAGANVQIGETGNLGATLYRTLGAAFPFVGATPGPDAYFVAGTTADSVHVDPDQLAARYRERQISSDVFLPELLSEILPKERTSAINEELKRGARQAVVASDDRPVAFLYALGLRQRIAHSAWAPLLAWSDRRPGWLVCFAMGPTSMLLLLGLVHRRVLGRAVIAGHATAVTGAAGLAASLLLFVSFQTRIGALYSEVGALSGLFMVGLAAGGYCAGRTISKRPLLKAQGVGLVASAWLVVGLWGLGRWGSSRGVSWPLHVALLVAAGMGTGIVFPSASRHLLLAPSREQAPAGASIRVAARVASSLEVWDHVGAALAALFFAVVFIPVLGLLRCAMLLLALETLACGVTWLGETGTSPRDGVR